MTKLIVAFRNYANATKTARANILFNMAFCKLERLFNIDCTEKTAKPLKRLVYRAADKSLARPGRKQANVCQKARISFGALLARKKKLDDSSYLDVVEIASVPDMLLSLIPSWSG